MAAFLKNLNLLIVATSSIPYIHPAVFLVLPALLCLLLILLILLIIYKRMKSKQKRRKEKERIRNYLVDDLSAQPLTADCSIEVVIFLHTSF